MYVCFFQILVKYCYQITTVFKISPVAFKVLETFCLSPIQVIFTLIVHFLFLRLFSPYTANTFYIVMNKLLDH
ncbi:hypothetical protein BpHYR1_001669 [Brachionus plicatilis]|uniref:Uncharacterized protein n=1 Tax=Brachionus plicatilis TaxID=10195 RepID=A0A3M7PA26_BRAPC|nr:hypothetical protein BpHYR1_001669 [Brachionus plicatilis]